MMLGARSLSATSPHIWRCSGCDFVVYRTRIGIFGRPALEDSSPPHWRIEGSVIIVKGRIDVIEEIPNYTGSSSQLWGSFQTAQRREVTQRTMSNNNTAYLIFWHMPMQHETKRHQDPWQVWGRKYKQSQKAQSGLRITARPYIYKTAAKGGAEKWYGQERR